MFATPWLLLVWNKPKKFSWSKMAKNSQFCLDWHPLLSLNLKDINLIVFQIGLSQKSHSVLTWIKSLGRSQLIPISQMTLLEDYNISEDAALILSLRSSVARRFRCFWGPEISLVAQLSIGGKLCCIHAQLSETKINRWSPGWEQKIFHSGH